MLTFWFVVAILGLCGAAIANKTGIPAEVIWCVLGCVAALLHDFPRLSPGVALFVLLPPLVYAAAVELPWPEFRDNLRPIALLAVGLVLASTAAVAVLAHNRLVASWSMAVLLGAILSPTDSVAATSIASHARLPRRVASILAGEGLVNDAVALTLVRLALTAAITGSFSMESGAIRFAAIAVGEPVYGVLTGVCIAALRKHITDPRIEIAVSLFTPYLAYVVPESLGGSGILATVAAGMYIGERRPTLVTAATRLQSTSFWRTIVFLLNGALFVMAGFQLGEAARLGPARSKILWWGLAAAATVIVVRFIWCIAAWLAVRLFVQVARRPGLGVPGSHVMVLAWSGMRGPISLAAALSVPPAAAAAGNDAILLTTAVVIGATLIAQGAALPSIIRLLDFSKEAKEDERRANEQQMVALREAAQAALHRLAQLERTGEASPEIADRLRRFYKSGIANYFIRTGEDPVRAQLIAAERKRILDLRNRGAIDDDVLERLQRTLDLREILLR
jgi:monovalent cation/hydrogen antiporter